MCPTVRGYAQYLLFFNDDEPEVRVKTVLFWPPLFPSAIFSPSCQLPLNWKATRRSPRLCFAFSVTWISSLFPRCRGRQHKGILCQAGRLGGEGCIDKDACMQGRGRGELRKMSNSIKKKERWERDWIFKVEWRMRDKCGGWVSSSRWTGAVKSHCCTRISSLVAI